MHQNHSCLYVGDPHVQVNNLKDCKKLLKFIVSQVEENNVHAVVFMGDLFHTHAVIRAEVLNFWNEAFKKIQKKCDVIALCGNHDMILGNSEHSGLNSLSVFRENFTDKISIVDKPYVSKNIGYLPYFEDTEQFLNAAKELYKQGATECLVAHQTFTGAQYENGFYAPDGIDPELVPQKHIISGHIHKQQKVGKCQYIGTPKWDTMSDANEDKGIWIFEHAADGSVLNQKFISTKEVVTPIYKHVIKEGMDEPVLVESAKNYIEFHGKSSWIKKMKQKYKGRAQIRAKPVDRKIVALEKNKALNLYEFLSSSFEPTKGVKKEDIANYLKEIINV